MDENQLVQFREIIRALLAQTRADRMEWEQGPIGIVYNATLASGRVILTKDNDSDTVIRIMDTDANLLGEINVGYRAHADLKADADELYQLARRSALKVDFKLESILREISS